MTKIIPSLLTACALLALSTAAHAAPAASAVALTKADLPGNVSIVAKVSQFYSPRSLNGDTVPFGLSVKQLKAAGFQGLYAQTIARSGDSNPYGYSWQYLDFSGPSGAEQIYQRWAKVFKYPFTTNGGQASVCEGRYYKVIAVQPAQSALICRSGNYVVLGHYSDKATLTSLMTTVLGHIKHARSS